MPILSGMATTPTSRGASPFGLSCLASSVCGPDDIHRHIHPRPRMDVVLAGADVGCAAGRVRRQPKHGPDLRRQWGLDGPFSAGGERELRAHFGANHFWNFSAGAVFSSRWIFFTPAAVAH